MESGVRIGFSLVVAVSMAMGAVQIEQRWIKRMAGDLWDLPGSYGIAEREDARKLKMEDLSHAMAQRLLRKHQIAEAVKKGGLSLSEAADQFLAAAKDTPYDWDTYRDTHSHLPLRARCALLVIDDVEQLYVEDQGSSGMVGDCLRGQVLGWNGQ